MHKIDGFVQKWYSFMINIAVFASGSGSNAENIIRYFSENSQVRVVLVVSNNKDAFVHVRAKQLDVPSCVFTKDEFNQGDSIIETLNRYNVDFIVLAGFLLKISSSLLNAYPQRIINIHPALLPKYGGKGMYGDRVHQAVVDSGDNKSGITIHYINENYDEGSIIYQASCDVLPTDSVFDLSKKVHELEYQHFPRVVEEVVQTLFSREKK